MALLHPRLLSVYTIQKGKGAPVVPQPAPNGESAQEGDNKGTTSIEGYQLVLVYEHQLARSAFSITVGHFGKVVNKDFICVQSLDGTISVFEQESHAFSRFLPGFLIPSPLVYVEKTDSFVTISSAYEVESYR